MFSKLPVDEAATLDSKINFLELNALDQFTGVNSLLRRIANTSDAMLDLLKKYIVYVWPARLPAHMLPNSKNKDEYAIQNGIVCKGIRFAPAVSFKSEILQILHTDHPGVVHTIRLAGQYL